MPQIYDRNDCAWTYRGDWAISHDGDIRDTYSDPLRSLFQEVRDIIKCDIGDWRIYPNRGAGLSDFVGEPNNKRTAEAIKARVVASLTRNGLINSADIKIMYTPIDIDKLLIRISIQVAQTAANNGTNSFGIIFGYNYAENNIYMLS